MSAPDPLTDFEDYVLWCECHACAACDGLGKDCDPNWVCGHCDGTGIEPGSGDECDDE